MDNFLGEFQQVMDVKNRIFIPAKFRETFYNGLYVTRHVDGCLAIYSEEGWRAYTDRLNSLPASSSTRIKRFIYATALDAKPDSQGRIVLTQALREHAGLTKDIYIVGVGDHVEIWDSERYERDMAQITPESVFEDMMKLGC